MFTSIPTGRLEKLLIPQLEYFTTLAESSAQNSMCFNTDKARPACLEAECNEATYTLNVRVAGRDLVCESDGQTHLIPETDTTFTCPNITMACPNSACPANCAGHGVCDFSLKRPTCKCFDPRDTSTGCFRSFVSVPPQRAWNGGNLPGSDSSRTTKSQHIIALSHLILLLAVGLI